MAYSTSSTALSSSVTSLRTSLSLLDSSISILDAGVSDFPRLKTVLATTRHFELTPSSSLAAAQASLASELEPAIATLLEKAEVHVTKLERREKGLIAKCELQEGRLGDDHFERRETQRRSTSRGLANGGGGREGREREAKLKLLRQKKERLGYVVERLELQNQQKQRQLRMSVNVPRNEDVD